MARNFKRVFSGLQLVGQSTITPTVAGEVRYNSATGFFQIYDSTTRNLVTDTGSTALTNKTLTGNTAVNLISGSGTLVLNTTGTITVPNGTDTLVALNTSDVLTNKTLTSPSITTPTGIVKGDVGLGNVDNTSDATKNAAAVTLTNKSIIDNTNKVYAAAIWSETATDGYVLTADGAGVSAWEVAPTAAVIDQSYELTNLTLAGSIASNILTIALKTKDGGDPGVSDTVKIGFRNSTATTGTYAQVEVSSALSLELGATVSLEFLTATSNTFYIYALNNAGTVELFASAHAFWDEGRVQTTSTLGTSNAVLYGDNVRTDKAIRLIGRMVATWTTGVGWSSLVNVDLIPFSIGKIACSYNTNTALAVVTTNPVLYEDKIFDTHNIYNVATGAILIPVAGLYQVNAAISTGGVDSNGTNIGASIVIVQAGSASTQKNGSFDIVDVDYIRAFNSDVSGTFNCVAGDTLTIKFFETIPAVNLSTSAAANWMECIKL